MIGALKILLLGCATALTFFVSAHCATGDLAGCDSTAECCTLCTGHALVAPAIPSDVPPHRNVVRLVTAASQAPDLLLVVDIYRPPTTHSILC